MLSMAKASRIAAVLLLGMSCAAMGMAIFASPLGLGLRFDFWFFRWFGIARTELAVIGFLLGLLAVAVWAMERACLVFRHHPVRLLLLIGSGVVPALFVMAWFGWFNGFATPGFAADACLGALWVTVVFVLLTIPARGAQTGTSNMAANLVLVVVSSLLALAGAEVAARLIADVPVFALRNWAAERNALLYRRAPIDQYDPALGWVQKPNLRLNPDDPNTSLTTSSRGFRLGAPDAAAPPAKGAIFAVGDSFTAGDAVGDRDSWPAQLGRLLRLPIINAATSGWAADQIVLRTESLLDNVMPTTVIVDFFDADILRAGLKSFFGANKPYFTLQDGKLIQHNTPVPRSTGRPSDLSAAVAVLGYSYFFVWTMDRLGLSGWWQFLRPDSTETGNDYVGVSCVLLQRLQRELARRQIRFLFVMEYGGWSRHRPIGRPTEAVKVLACAAKAGIETVDLWPDLAAIHRRSFADYVKFWAASETNGRNVFGHMLGGR